MCINIWYIIISLSRNAHAIRGYVYSVTDTRLMFQCLCQYCCHLLAPHEAIPSMSPVITQSQQTTVAESIAHLFPVPAAPVLITAQACTASNVVLTSNGLNYWFIYHPMSSPTYKDPCLAAIRLWVFCGYIIKFNSVKVVPGTQPQLQNHRHNSSSQPSRNLCCAPSYLLFW